MAPEAFGQYRAAFAFVGLFRILPDFGMSYASTLAISRDRSIAERLTGTLLGFQALLSLLTLALCLGIGRSLFEGVTWSAVVVLAGDLILKSVKSTLRWLLKSFERFDTESLSLLIERASILLLGVLSLRAGYGVVGFVLVFLLLRIPDTLGLWLYTSARVMALRPAYDRALWWDLFRKGLPFAYAGAMILLFFQVDAVMLEQMRGPTEVGWYGAPVAVLEGLSLVPRVLSYALIPTMASLFTKQPQAVTGLYRRGSKYLLLIGLPIAAFGAIAADPFIPMLFGKDYLPSVLTSRILLPAAAFMFLSNFGETTLACVNRWRSIVIVSTLALVLNVALNLLLIPTNGYLGAAWATLFTEAAYFVMTAAALFAHGHRVAWPSLALKPALAAAAFAATLWLCRGLPLALAALLASAAWLVASFALRVWDEKETELLARLLRRGSLQEP